MWGLGNRCWLPRWKIHLAIFFPKKSDSWSGWILFLMVEMDSAPSKTYGAPKILKFDSCNLDLHKFPLNYNKILLEFVRRQAKGIVY